MSRFIPLQPLRPLFRTRSISLPLLPPPPPAPLSRTPTTVPSPAFISLPSSPYNSSYFSTSVRQTLDRDTLGRNETMSSYYKRTHQPPPQTQQRSFSSPTQPSSPPPVVLDKGPSGKFHRTSPPSILPKDPVITVSDDQEQPNPQSLVYAPRPDKASRVLGIKHRRSMEPIPASTRTSVVSSHSARPPAAEPAPSGPTFPLTTLYIVSGLPKSPHTWTLADPDSVLGLHHSEGAVNRWWRPEVLGSTVSPGAGGGSSKRNRKKAKVEEGFSSAGYLSKQDVGKILSKALKVSLSRYRIDLLLLIHSLISNHILSP